MPLAHELAVTFGRLAANHLWQSTGFAAVAVVLAWALRANSARVRYGLWLAASVKFLIPFSALAALGGGLGRWLVPATPVSRVPLAIEEIVQPFAPLQGTGLPAAFSVPAPSAAGLLPVVLLAIWLCGFVAVLLYWWVRWRRVAAAVRASTPLTEGREVEALRRLRWGGRSFSVVCQQGRSRALTGHKKRWPVPLRGLLAPQSIKLVSSAARLEPGVFGIFRPVLWLPAGIGDRLDNAELEAILAHELCHVRRRDNLAAVIHMAVEAVFWFHPLVWWLGERLTEERERACDEEVVRMGGEPQVYAESILKVCEFYLASPVACAAGVTGGELKKRIEGIMANRLAREMSFGRRALLASAALLAIAGPIAIGLMNMPRGSAQLQTGGAKAPANMAVTESLFIEPPAGSRNPGAPPPSPVPQIPGGSSGRPAKREPARFEVVSIKPCGTSTSERDSIKAEPTRIRLGCTTAEHLILLAYVVYADDAPLPRGASPADVLYDAGASIQSGPSWLGSQRFTIEATTNVPSSVGEMRGLLMQGVLKERFKLRLHEGSRPMAVYELVQDKGGAKLPPAKEGSCFEMDSTKTPQQASGGKAPPPVCGGIRASAAGGVDAFHVTTSDLSRRLSNALGKPLVDKTGLTGTYDVHLEVDINELPMARGLYRSQPQSADSGNLEVGDPSGSVFGAMRKLGLQVKSAKGTAKVIVIDHIELPSAN